jgi:hypothetical protein
VVTISDERMLGAIAQLYADFDPAPDDLADGVLARLAVEDLEREYELLTLVDQVDLTAGVRRAADPLEDSDNTTVGLEFAGSTYRVLVRISTVDGHRRLDGWVLPAVPMDVFLGPRGDGPQADDRQRARVDEQGRFEFAAPPKGQTRLWLVPQVGNVSDSGEDMLPFATPPFLI